MLQSLSIEKRNEINGYRKKRGPRQVNFSPLSIGRMVSSRGLPYFDPLNTPESDVLSDGNHCERCPIATVVSKRFTREKDSVCPTIMR